MLAIGFARHIAIGAVVEAIATAVGDSAPMLEK